VTDFLKLKSSYEWIYAEIGLHADDPSFYPWIVRLLLKNVGGGRLLDVACGEGGIVYEAGRRGFKAYGLDISEQAIRKARNYISGDNFVVGAGESLPFASESFDCTTCLGSLENMGNSWKALSELIRITKQGGFLLVQMPNIYWLGEIIEALYRKVEPPPFQEFERSATRNSWRTFLMEGGLKIEKEFRYNKPSPLFRNRKIRSIRKFVVRSFLNLMTPFNWSWSLIYLCRKGTSSGSSQTSPGYYTIWEARQLKVVPGRTEP